MPTDCIVISGHNIYGYTHYEKVNTDELGKHIKTILAQNQYTGFTVKILNQYTPFLARVEGLENIAVVEQEDTKVWHLSPLTLFNMFDEEKKTGAFTFPEEV